MSEHAVTGYVTYGVHVTCPHCNHDIDLNEYPYDDDQHDLSLEEDLLGKAVFGGVDEPATWSNFKIEYKCCQCKKEFSVTNLQT